MLLRASSVSCVNEEFPKDGYLQPVLALHVWVLLGPLKRNNLEFFQRDMLGTHLHQQKWDWGVEAVEPSNSSDEPLLDLLEPEYPMCAGNLPKHTGDPPT